MTGSAAIETVLVTGATGFIGSHVVDIAPHFRLHMRALVRKATDAARLKEAGFECVQGSLDDAAALADAMSGVDAVLHLAAAKKGRTPAEYERANVAGTQAVVKAMLVARARRLVYLSSLAAVGPPVNGRPVTRDDPPRPLTTYGRTKLAGEIACQAASDRLEIAILRGARRVWPARSRHL